MTHFSTYILVFPVSNSTYLFHRTEQQKVRNKRPGFHFIYQSINYPEIEIVLNFKRDERNLLHLCEHEL